MSNVRIVFRPSASESPIYKTIVQNVPGNHEETIDTLIGFVSNAWEEVPEVDCEKVDNIDTITCWFDETFVPDQNNEPAWNAFFQRFIDQMSAAGGFKIQPLHRWEDTVVTKPPFVTTE